MSIPMSTRLSLENKRLTLEHHGRFQDRDFTAEDRELLETLARDYRTALKHHDRTKRLFELGQRLYQWLDRQRWLSNLRPVPRPPWLFEIRTPEEPNADECALLDAPWELLADEKGYLAARLNRQFAPIAVLARRASRWRLPNIGSRCCSWPPRRWVSRCSTSRPRKWPS